MTRRPPELTGAEAIAILDDRCGNEVEVRVVVGVGDPDPHHLIGASGELAHTQEVPAIERPPEDPPAAERPGAFDVGDAAFDVCDLPDAHYVTNADPAIRELAFTLPNDSVLSVLWQADDTQPQRGGLLQKWTGALTRGLGEDGPDTLSSGLGSPLLVARVLAGLFAAGATLIALIVLLAPSPRMNEGALLGVVIAAFATAAILGRIPKAVQVWALGSAVTAGTLMITLAAYFSGDRPSPLIFFYLWVFLYSSYFFTPKHAVGQIGFAAVAYGVLLATDSPPDGAARWWLVGLASMLVGAAVVAIMRQRNDHLVERLHDIACRDALTQLVNRRGFHETFENEIERGRREARGFALVVGDIDHFKQVNDRFGHPQGDEVLRRVANIIAQNKRRIDTAARLGGEEFALLLPGVEQDGAFAFAERLRARLLEEFGNDPLPITMSFGIADFPADGLSASELLHRGDRALYMAKQSGRDRTVRFRDLDAPESTEADSQSHARSRSGL